MGNITIQIPEEVFRDCLIDYAEENITDILTGNETFQEKVETAVDTWIASSDFDTMLQGTLLVVTDNIKEELSKFVLEDIAYKMKENFRMG